MDVFTIAVALILYFRNKIFLECRYDSQQEGTKIFTIPLKAMFASKYYKTKKEQGKKGCKTPAPILQNYENKLNC